jgi:hypothetical protein
LKKNSDLAFKVRKSMYKLNSFKAIKREKKFASGKLANLNLVLMETKSSKSLANFKVTNKEMERCINEKMTYPEIHDLDIDELLQYDKRNSFRFYFDLLKKEHLLIQTFSLFSAINPRPLMIILFYLQISVQFALNGIFYSDDLIEARNNYPQETRSDKITYEIYTLPSKVLPSIIFAVILNYFIMALFFNPTTRLYRLLNERLITRKEYYMDEGM